MRFEFATANRIVFGPGVLKQVAPIAAEHGRRPLVVTGRHGDRAAPLLDLLRQNGLTPTVFAVTGEPTVDRPAPACRKLGKPAAIRSSASAAAVCSTRARRSRCC